MFYTYIPAGMSSTITRMTNQLRCSGLFVCGSDTDVGKTYIGSHLAAFLYASGYAVEPRKPAESGCKEVDGELVPRDAVDYLEAVNRSTELKTICRYRYLPPLAPPLAARLAGETLTLDHLIDAVGMRETGRFYLVEGAGGVYSPIAEDGFNLDLCKALRLPSLLVVENRLGCINQALMALKALENESISVLAIVLNTMKNEPEVDYGGNIKALQALIKTPVIPHEFGAPTEVTSQLITSLLKNHSP